MNKTSTLKIHIISKSGDRDIPFQVKDLVIAAYTGRDQDALQRHIEELAKLGVPAPRRTPTSYVLPPELLTNSEEIRVESNETSGEVEAVLLFDEDETYITVGSDHTDRPLERVDVRRAKLACPKVIAKSAWVLKEVEDHLDNLILSSWTSRKSKEPYQRGTLREVMRLRELVEVLGVGGKGTVLFCGTIPTLAGHIVYSDEFLVNLSDPLEGREIGHGYRILTRSRS
ncbi:MAG: DUF2848 domain-containing protein [Aigarchaeota archaeon]|nr:DUF2848 domain-containing protein [Aigarchaeota archaeon]MDW8092808.1 DUF2848 family protein [Nitrososphaerota archaeon]